MSDIISTIRVFLTYPPPYLSMKFSQIEGAIENFYNIKPKIQCAKPTVVSQTSVGKENTKPVCVDWRH